MCRQNNISVTVVYDGEPHVIKTYASEYRNLMMLISDKLYPEEFGDCGGMGRCGTCLVEVMESPGKLSSFDRNEKATIARIGVTGGNVRLSCQILIDENIDGLKLNIS
jgi:2Fe-2S ferredoxin